MENILKRIVDIIMWVVSVFCLLGFFMFEAVGFKIVSLVAAILACPLVNRYLCQKINSRRQSMLRAVALLAAVALELIAMIASPITPVTVDEQLALRASVDVLESKYKDYQNIDVKDYKFSVGEEENGVQPVSLTLSIEATKQQKKTKLNEEITLYFDTKTGKYLTEKPEGEV